MKKTFDITQILVYYDTPELFVCTDNVGTHYLSMLSFDDDEGFKYLTTPISVSRLSKFINGKIDLLQIYTIPEVKDLFFISVTENGKAIFCKNIDGALQDEWLPSEGFYLTNNISDDDSVIRQEVIEKDNAIIHLAISDEKNDYGIYTDDLGDITKLYSAFLENSFKKTLSKENKATRTKNNIPQNYRVRAFASSPSSFNIHLYSESINNGFGDFQIERALEKIDEIFNNINSQVELITILRSIKGHPISNFKKILEKVSSNNLKLKHKWFAPNREHVSKHIIDKNEADRVLELLYKREELAEEIKEYIGHLIQVDTERKTWRLRISETGKDIFGEASNEEQLKGLTIETIRYKLVCREIIEELEVSEKENVKYIIKSIEESA